MKRSVGEKVFDFFNVVFLGLFGISTVFPFWNVIMTSFTTATEYYSKPIIIWPESFNLTAYQFILSTDWILSGFKTSIMVTIMGTAYVMFLTCTAAYGLYKKDLPGKKFFMTYFLITMYFGGGIIPYYIVVTRYLRLTDSILSLTITGGLGVWGFLVLRNFFKDIPESLPESAMLDGANEYVILFRIMLPLSLPVLATLTLFSAVGFWNDWFRAQLFINSDYKQPLQMVLRKMIMSHYQGGGTAQLDNMVKAYSNLTGGAKETLFEEAVKAATISVVTVPIMCVYPFLQKYFAKGVLIGSIKE